MSAEKAVQIEVARAFVQHARNYLKNDYLPKLKRCLESLTDEQVWWRANEESNSIGNLLLHLSGNARQWLVSGLGREADHRERQQEFDERSLISRDELLARLETTLTDVDRVLADFDVERILEQHQIQGTAVTALEAIFHVTEHFSMHTGQIILITKMLTQTDLRFYEFDGTTPITRWHSN
ncbi:MAG TPA: DinB family protein [Pyrinomonadaceae bacterium]|nr:DinB family protein [Pyrinomonadaceae bacterium]